MTKKEKLILNIKFFFINNEIEEVDLTEILRSFVTSTGKDEGDIEIIKVRQSDFSYTPSGHFDDGMESYYEDLSVSDLEEILDSLEQWKTELEKTIKRCKD